MGLRELKPSEGILPFAGTIEEPTRSEEPKLRSLRPDESIAKQGPMTTFGIESGSEAMAMGQELLARKKAKTKLINSELTNILGKKYDPSSDFDAEGSFIAQSDIARSVELSDKQKKWRDLYYPEGSLISVPTSDGAILLGRESQDKPYRRIGMAETITGAVASEPTALGTLGSVFGVPGTFAGTFAGSQIQSGVESLRGYGEGQYGYLGSLGEAAVAAGADVVFRGFGRFIKGRVRPKSEVESLRDAIQATQELGLEPIAVGQIGGPFERGVFRQVGVTSPKIEQKITAQQESLLESFRRMGDEIPETTTDDILLDVVRAQQRELGSLLNFRRLSRSDAGEALQKGIDTWKKASRRLRDRLYNKAHELADDITYVLGPAKDIAHSIERGVGGWTAAGDVTRLSATPKGELKEIVDTLISLDDIVSKLTVRDARIPSGQAQIGEGPIIQEWTAFEQIKTLRTRLFDLKNSEQGDIRREATRLWKALTDVMDNPISGNPDFVKAHKKARGFNRLREDTLEKSYVAQAINRDTPEAIARKYMTPGDTTALLAIRDLIPRPQWKEFSQAFQLDLMNARTADMALNRLNTFRALDPEALRVLVNPVEEAQLEKYLLRKASFDKSPAQKIMRQHLTEGEKFVGMAKQGSAGDIADAVRLSGGKTSEYAQAAKAGIYKDILDNSMSITELGQEILDVNKLLSNINTWKKSGKLKELFTETDWRTLTLYEKYAAPLSAAADVGGAMMGGGLRQEAIRAPTEITVAGGAKRIFLKLARPLISNDITAWLLTRPASVTRIHAAKEGGLPLRNLGIALAIVERQYEKTKPKSQPLQQGPETPKPVFHKGGLVTKDAGLRQLAEKYDAIPDLQRDKQLRQLHHYNNKTFNQLLDYLENR